MEKPISFNKPYITGKETTYIEDAVIRGKISGNGYYTKLCQSFFEEKYSIQKALLTTSCTDALEMCALLLNIQPGDEVIIPSYTFVSTANAFALRGAKIIFADSKTNHPNIDETKIESLITPKTKAIVVVHYAGVACHMDEIMKMAKKHQIFVVEDAAQGIDATYKGKPLGSIGHLGTFSFHETKNIQCGEGGLLAINDKQFIDRSEIIWEKGTNRSAFFRGEIDKYGWVDLGSSYLPSEINAAFLWAQLENLDDIQTKRIKIWNQYYKELKELKGFSLPFIDKFGSNNAHMFYLLCPSLEVRTQLITYLKKKGVSAVFHYQSLHNSPFFKNKYKGGALINSDRYTSCIVRLPFYCELKLEEVREVCGIINGFFDKSLL